MWKKLALAALLGGILAYSFSDSLPGRRRAEENRAYYAQLRAVRQQKDRSLKSSPDSPLTRREQKEFDSLRYFVPDARYRIRARLTRLSGAQASRLTLPMSDGSTETYYRWGLVRFEWEGKPQQLLLLHKASADSREGLFLPFADASNGRGSYGGGRYLDLPLPAAADQEITLDFNQAYNPYCAYNNRYNCPVPPAENRLSMAVEAGEQAFHE